MAKVSIVVPVYNVEPYLRECLDSVLAQTFEDWECICVDDGSTDESSAILDEYTRKDERIRVIRQPNGGLSAARNTGMNAATGKYLYFLDSDDTLVSEAIERLYGLAETKKLDQILFGAELVVESDWNSSDGLDRMARYYEIPKELLHCTMDGPSLFSRLVERCSFFASVPLRFFLRTALPSSLRFPVGLLHEDNYFSPLALLGARQAIAIPDRLYRRRIRKGSITTETECDARHANGMLGIYRGLVRARRSGLVPKNARVAFRSFLQLIYRRFLRYAGRRPSILRPLDFVRGHGLFAPFARRMKRIRCSTKNDSVR